MKTVTVLNERAKLIPVHDLSEVVAIYRVFYDDAACNVVVEDEERAHHQGPEQSGYTSERYDLGKV